MSNNRLKLYFVMGSMNVEGRNPLTVLEGALKGGVTCFQLSEKGLGALVGEELKEFAQRCKFLCAEYRALFIINGDVDLAVEIGADGVHIEQKGEDYSVIREKIGSNMLLGITTHTASDAFAAADAGASYIGVGPVFESKSGKDGLVVGLGIWFVSSHSNCRVYRLLVMEAFLNERSVPLFKRAHHVLPLLPRLLMMKIPKRRPAV